MMPIKALLLAAGTGTRLKPLTDFWPKCLMPISGRPLLEDWLCKISREGISDILVNVHHHQKHVEKFLARDVFTKWVSSVYEESLLGTAGTLIFNAERFQGSTVFLVHADNWCQCDLSKFIQFHQYHRPSHTVITMMTFRTSTPETCGIVEIDSEGVVQRLHEKVSHPPGNLANGAVYLLEQDVVRSLTQEPKVADFSKEVLPKFLGRIATWENKGIHRDIGAIQSLLDAQQDLQPVPCWPSTDEWTHEFRNNPVHEQLNTAIKHA